MKHSSSSPLVALVDDEASVTDALSFLLDSVRIDSRAFASGKAFLAELPSIDRPVCAVVDLRMPELSGMELQQRLKETGEDLPLLFLTAHGDVPAAVEAMRNGAVDFIQKPFNPDAFLNSVNTLIRIARERHDEKLRRGRNNAALAKLTPRERQVLQGLLRAQSSKQIARDLGMNPKTVDVHRANLMHKLAVRSRDQLLLMFGKFDEDDASGTPAIAGHSENVFSRSEAMSK